MPIRQSTADQRYPEHPKLLERRRPGSGGAGAAGRIDAGVGDRDADQVDERRSQADGDGAKPAGARVSVEPRMIIRKPKVGMISIAIPEAIE